MNHEPETAEQWAQREADRLVNNMTTSLNAQAEELAKACGQVDCQCLPISDSEREYLGNLYETQDQQSFARSIFENSRKTKRDNERLEKIVNRLRWSNTIIVIFLISAGLTYIAHKIGLI